MDDNNYWLVIMITKCIIDDRMHIYNIYVFGPWALIFIYLIYHMQREDESFEEPKQDNSFMTITKGIFWFCFSVFVNNLCLVL